MDTAERLRYCEKRWRLRIGARMAGGFGSDVFDCGDVVLKLSATPEQFRDEAAALAAWAGTGAAVRLLDVEPAASALLLARIRPGIPLRRGEGRIDVDVAGELLAALHAADPGGFRFPSLQEAYPGCEDVARTDLAYERRTRNEPNRGIEGERRLAAAGAAALSLCRSAPRTVLLHGDFLTKNLLPTETGYLAVDPLPHIGEPAADVGSFAADHPPATIMACATTMADVVGADAARSRRWAAVWTVLQATQAWRDDQAELDGLVAREEFAAILDGR